jgi:hypothetical protein
MYQKLIRTIKRPKTLHDEGEEEEEERKERNEKAAEML